MPTYYVDPTDGGSNAGTMVNPWQSIEHAINGTGGSPPTAGDTVLLKANGSTPDETPSATATFDQASGSQSGGFIKWIGVNSSWVNDGTRYIIDGSSLATGNPVAQMDQSVNRGYYWFENLDLRNATNESGWKSKTGSFSGNYVFVNVRFADNDFYGVYAYQANNYHFSRCVFDGNTLGGFHYPYAGVLIAEFCSFIDNGGSGSGAINIGNAMSCVYVHGCIFDANYYHVRGSTSSGSWVLTNNIFCRSTASGIYLPTSTGQRGLIARNRFAFNGTYDIECQSAMKDVIEDYNVFYDPGTASRLNIDAGPNSRDDTANETELGFTDHTSSSWNRDFNLTTSAILRSSGLVVPLS